MNESPKPDFKRGVPLTGIPDGGSLLGAVDGDEVLLVRRGTEVLAVSAHCTHYHGPLAEGLVVGDQIRCPWHHACFDLRTGEALRAPALDPIQCWNVEQRGGNAFVTEKAGPSSRGPVSAAKHPVSVVIVGGGAAGLAAAEMLRREGYVGPVTMISADSDPPVDRPNLSKDYLAGTAQEEWIPLRPPEWYSQHEIELVLNTRVTSLDTKQKSIATQDGRTYEYGALLLATGADPVQIPLEGADPSRVFYLRSFADSKAISEQAKSATQAVVVGAGFIGLEVAASLRARGLSVRVVALDKVPMGRVLGPGVGAFLRKLHESRGVIFHLGETVKQVNGSNVTLSGGRTVQADFIVLGVGVRPSIALAEQAGVKVNHGVEVNEYLQTSAPDVFAAGDIARWPDPHTGERIRVEHWVVAERQGQTAAKNILGQHVRFDFVPFFWSQHYDIPINYVGHAEKWDAINVDGEIGKNYAVRYRLADKTLAVATILRDLESLTEECKMEQPTGVR